MRIALFSAKPYDIQYFKQMNQSFHHELEFISSPLNKDTTFMAQGFDAVCAFVNDSLSKDALEKLHTIGIRYIALRCAGFNNLDLAAAKALDIKIVRVPEYSPYSVAEHTIGLILMLNRKLHKAYNRVREGNFALDGLLGFDLHNKTVGVIGTGKIGTQVARILHGFGCKVLGYDPKPNRDASFVHYVEMDTLLKESDIISLNCPLNSATQHLINEKTLQQMKRGVMLINTGRGGLIDSKAVINALKTGQLGYLGLDVYEQEGDLFFEDHSRDIIKDDIIERLLTFPNVVVTGHQGFFTHEALSNIAHTTLQNLSEIEKTGSCRNLVQ